MASGNFESSTFPEAYLNGLKDVIDTVDIRQIRSLISCLKDAYEQDKQIFIVGNGGSATTASHMASDLAKTILSDNYDPHRKRFRVLALTDNMALITAWSNDVSFDSVFSQQLRLFARPGDLLIVITGSGNSRNILEAVSVGKELGMKAFGMLGRDGGMVKSLLNDIVLIPHDNYGFIEDMHMVICHLVTGYFKEVLKHDA